MIRPTSIALTLAASSAMACEPTVGVHLATYHVDRHANSNEFNPGIYAMCNGWTGGVYRNSERGTSYYAGHTVRVGWLDITVGVIGGYMRGTLPMVVPSVLLPGGVRLAFLPPIPKASHNTAGLHLMKEF